MKASVFQKIVKVLKSDEDSNREKAILTASLGGYYLDIYGDEDDNYKLNINDAFLKVNGDMRDVEFTQEQEAILQGLLNDEAERQYKKDREKGLNEEMRSLENEDDLKHQNIEGWYYDRARIA